MSKAIEDLYRATKKMIKQIKEYSNGNVEPLQHMIDDHHRMLDMIEDTFPWIREEYERKNAVEQSFTPAQIGHICYQIGDWYLEWKDKIISDSDKGMHRLGIAKEQLKTMICGD